MLKRFACLALTLGGIVYAAPAVAQDDCASAVLAPDSTSLTILFNDLSVDAKRRASNCSIAVPLNLPAGYSLGVYRVDYRGYALLAKKERATLQVDYGLGPKGKGRQFRRSVKDPTDDDFAFAENIGAGLMKRVGCGGDAVLSATTRLKLDGGANASAVMDSSDGASRHGLVYRFNLRKC